MARRNLYIPDENEPLIMRLEKSLERSGQSLSDFFMQSARSAVPTVTRGRGQVTKPSIAEGVECAVAVDSTWRHSMAVNAIMGPPDNPRVKSSDSSLIFAKVLNGNDPFGLWIELNSEQKRNPGYPVLQFAIPWRFVLAVCPNPEAVPGEEAAAEGRRIGFTPEMDTTSMLTRDTKGGG